MATDAGEGDTREVSHPTASRRPTTNSRAGRDRSKIRIGRRIEELAVAPRPRNTIKLEGEEDLYRNRVGQYRIIYGIRDEELIVLVLEVGHRRNRSRLIRAKAVEAFGPSPCEASSGLGARHRWAFAPSARRGGGSISTCPGAGS